MHHSLFGKEGPIDAPFGRLLRHWRATRGLAQFDLSRIADVSPRHLSFLETGRSRPGQEVVLRLADALDLPLRERNQLLEAAGLPAIYPHSAPHDTRLAPYRRVLDRMFAAHEPFPCLVLDRWWNLLDANATARALFGVAPPVPAAALTDLLYGPGPMREAMVNWAEVAWHGLERLRGEARAAGLPSQLTSLVARVEAHLVGVPRPRLDPVSGAIVVCPVFSFGGRRVRTMSTLTHFGGALDVGLDEVRIEHIFAADAESEAFFRERVGSARETSP